MDWTNVIAIGVFVVGLSALMMNSSAKYLSIREHETYNSFVVRELDAIKERISVLERTRPTTGELEAKLGKKTNCDNRRAFSEAPAR